MMEKPPLIEPKEQKNEPEALAQDIAKGLEDLDNIELYLDLCKKYPREIVSRAFSEVKEIPDYKIKKSRRSYFAFLIKKYAEDKEIR